jgi:hypothetical protein
VERIRAAVRLPLFLADSYQLFPESRIQNPESRIQNSESRKCAGVIAPVFFADKTGKHGFI